MAYYDSTLAEGELLGIREDDRAVSVTELLRMDAEAMHRVNCLLLAIGGPTVVGPLVVAWIADQAAVPPIIVLLAQKIAAAEVWKRWEQFNLGVVARDDATNLRNSDKLMEEVKDIARSIKDSKVLFDVNNVIINLSGGDANRGPVVGGPMKNGSLFTSGYYYDEDNKQWTSRHIDPFKIV